MEQSLIVKSRWLIFLVALAGSLDAAPTIGTVAIPLDPAHYRQWPRGGEALSVYKTQLLDRDISGIAAIRAVTAGDGLTIHGTRELASTRPVAFHFDVQGRKWSRLEE